ncbi:outer membrane protein [Methylopila musalis]|uniref:Outer membrane protein n=1 Tax=Methylopila musalis TaxID=1134781 RepID=A0ABW3Z541_9HYPH
MRLKRIAAAAVAASLAPAAAFAADLGVDPVVEVPAIRHGGPYVALGGGVNFLQKQDIPHVDAPFGRQPGGWIRSETGWIALGSLGWDFGNGFRVEAEASHRRNGFDRATAGALLNEKAGGRQETTAVFANVFYDFDLAAYGLNTSIKPYVGAGVGYGWSRWNNVYVTKPGEFVRHRDTDGGVALQGIVGAAAPISEGLSLTAEYRLMSLLSDRSYKGRVEESRFGSFPIKTKVEDGLNHSVLIGLRYAFGS